MKPIDLKHHKNTFFVIKLDTTGVEKYAIMYNHKNYKQPRFIDFAGAIFKKSISELLINFTSKPSATITTKACKGSEFAVVFEFNSIKDLISRYPEYFI